MVKRILVVEDDPAREQAIRSWLPPAVRPVVAPSAGAAIGTLRRDRGMVYAAILLDHDLQSRRASEEDHHLSGEHVADAIVDHVDRAVPILIHSMNPSGRATMASRLRRAGFTVAVVPIEELSAEGLQAWLAGIGDPPDG
jgi:CheY-like chemotaxis protein